MKDTNIPIIVTNHNGFRQEFVSVAKANRTLFQGNSIKHQTLLKISRDGNYKEPIAHPIHGDLYVINTILNKHLL